MIPENGAELDTIEISPGDTPVAICRCRNSNTYPLCDGSHQNCEETIRPAIVKVVDE